MAPGFPAAHKKLAFCLPAFANVNAEFTVPRHGGRVARIGVFVLANAWVVALVPVSLVAVYLTAVRHEEAYLEREFGEAYLSYKASVLN